MKTMKNNNFIVKIDSKTGCITQITNPNDTYGMNWCSDIGLWGRVRTPNPNIASKYCENLAIKSIDIQEQNASVVYVNDKLEVTTNRFFKSNGNLTEQVIIQNITNTVICINRDNFGIEFPFNDQYTYADDCMTNRCHTHIWCGYNTSWINALKMGDSEINLGLMLTKGAFISYSQYNCINSNTRGIFILEPETVLLKSNEKYMLEWELFWHKGKKDFLTKLSGFSSYIGIDARHFTVFENEKDEFMVKPPFAELVEKRINFIVDRQQCVDSKSPLYGAYLIYDNKISSQYFDFFNADHNACRERLNMALTIIRYLQLHDDNKLRRSIDLFINFLFREFYEEETGEVFNNIGKNQDALRLYNAPGVMLVFAEMYYLTKNNRYLDNIMKLSKKYYSIGGEKCYSNAVAIKKVLDAFALSGRTKDMETMLEFFQMHVNHMIENGTSYPKHEVNYEQTIVTPAVNCISEMGLFCEDKERYISNAKKHLECLDRFLGYQPSFHLNEIAIRYWDDFWFGKSRKYGDTLPHHLSCLSARAFIAYSRLTGDKKYVERAEECIRDCLCLIGDNGEGFAAYVYPHIVNNQEGEFYDEWANDQDLPLYDAMNFCDLIETFKIEK